MKYLKEKGNEQKGAGNEQDVDTVPAGRQGDTAGGSTG